MAKANTKRVITAQDTFNPMFVYPVMDNCPDTHTNQNVWKYFLECSYNLFFAY